MLAQVDNTDGNVVVDRGRLGSPSFNPVCGRWAVITVGKPDGARALCARVIFSVIVPAWRKGYVVVRKVGVDLSSEKLEQRVEVGKVGRV